MSENDGEGALRAWLVELTRIDLASAGFFAMSAALVFVGAVRMKETARTTLMGD